MAVSPILMPKLGLTMTEGTIASWQVAPGHKVSAGTVLFVVETDKIATEVEARDEGEIREIKVAEGETVEVGAIVATWTGPSAGADLDADGSGAEPAAARQADTAPTPPAEAAPAVASAAVDAGARVLSTPLARRMARAGGIAIGEVTGTGPRGRIKARDVAAHRQEAKAAPQDLAPNPDSEVVPGASVRSATSFEKTIARRMTEAKQQTPHFYVMAEADLTSLLSLRTELNGSGRAGAKVSVNHLILLAVGRALLGMPEMTSVWQDGRIATLGGSDVGVAIDTEKGLFAPVLRSAGDLRIDALAAAADAAASRARGARLSREELSGGATTVSNVGMFGAAWLVPIINLGQSSIIGVGATKRQFLPDDAGAPALRSILPLTFSGDHRVLNGVQGARFLAAITALLERPLDLVR